VQAEEAPRRRVHAHHLPARVDGHHPLGERLGERLEQRLLGGEGVEAGAELLGEAVHGVGHLAHLAGRADRRAAGEVAGGEGAGHVAQVGERAHHGAREGEGAHGGGGERGEAGEEEPALQLAGERRPRGRGGGGHAHHAEGPAGGGRELGRAGRARRRGVGAARRVGGRRAHLGERRVAGEPAGGEVARLRVAAHAPAGLDEGDVSAQQRAQRVGEGRGGRGRRAARGPPGARGERRLGPEATERLGAGGVRGAARARPPRRTGGGRRRAPPRAGGAVG
jgi:hypothetical protein